jgi:hypothetical protein
MKKADEIRRLSCLLDVPDSDRPDVLGPRSFRATPFGVGHLLALLERIIAWAFHVRRVEEHVLVGSSVDKSEALVRLFLDRTL